VTITGTTGANYEAVNTTGTINNTVVDDADATTVTLTASAGSVVEGNTITYTATVSNAVTGSPLVVTLDNGTTITIPVGATSANSAPVIVRADDVYAQGTTTVVRSIASTSGGNYEALTTTSTVSTSVTEDADATTVTLSSATNGTAITEGGSIVYTATVNNAVTGTPLVVTLSNGATITIPVGQTTANSAPVPVRADDAYAQGTQTLAPVTITGTTGANYEAVNTTGTINNTVVDDADATTVSLAGSASVNEGAAGSYTVSLTNAAQTNDVVVTLSYSGTASSGADYTGVTTVTIPAGSISANFNINTIDDLIAEGNEDFTFTIVSATGGNFENLVISPTNPSVTTTIVDNEPVPELRVEVNDALNSFFLNEASGYAHFTVSLSYASGVNTTVALALSNGTATGAGADYGSTGATNIQVSFDNGATWTNATSATIPAGSTSFVVRTPVIDDALNEFNETFSLTATRTAGATSNPSATASTTINDNDFNAPDVTIGNVSVNESAGTVTFTVSLSTASGKSISVDYATSNGSATAGADYTAATGTLNFAPGVLTQTITIPIAEDLIFEGNENFLVNLSNAVNAQITVPTGTGTIIDNEVAPTISVNNVTVAESGGFAVYTVSQSGVSSTNTNFFLGLINGTATLGQDYTNSIQISTDGGLSWITASSGSIPAGNTSVLVRVPVTDDTVFEGNETFTLTANVTSGNTSNASATGTATINDNDASPTIASVSAASVTEGGNLVHTVNLSNASSTATTFAYSLSGTTATAGTDFNTTATFSNGVTLSGGTLTVPAGVTSFTVTYATVNDTIFEPTETTALTVGGVTGVGSIVDNDLAPTISSVSAASVTEGGNLVHTVNLSNASSTATTFAYSLSGTTATAGTDFNTTATFSNGVTLSGGTLTVPAGVTSFTVTYATVNDTLNEVNETTALTIGGVTGVGTINDNDPIPTLSINNVSVNESAGTATFTVTLNAASGQTVTVNYATSNGTATAGSDYSSTTGGLTFAPGVITQTITVPITNDLLAEASETFNVVLSTPTNATIAVGTGVGTIIDNDQLPSIDLDANNSTAAGNNYTATFTENGTAVSIADTDIAITDVDSTNLASATITLTNAQAGDVLAAGGMPPGITATVVGNVVTLTGSASLASYQTAIRAITYSSTSENPSTTPRTINVVVNDGQSNSNIAVATINVVAVNDAPVGVADVFNGANSVVEATTVVRGNVLTNDTDVDSSTLTVAQFATNSGSTATTANGSNAITTALGGTVVMNADGTFTYTAPVRNHGDATSDVDSFVYRATDGSLNSAWTTVTINVTDSQLLANSDTDSVGVGGSTTGNVLTGAGGATADVLGADSPVAITNVTIAGALSNTLGAGNVRTIVTNNGTLVIDQDDGSYTYTSSLQTKSLASGGTASTTEWTSSGYSVYGFDTNGTQTNDLYGGNTNSINLANLNATSAGRVRARNNGTNDMGIGVESTSTTGTAARIENSENLVIDIGFLTNSANITLTALSASESAVWRAYDASGNIVGSGTITGNAGQIVTSTISPGSDYRYLVLTSSAATYLVDGLSAQQSISSLTPDVFTYTIADADGSTSTTTLTVTTDSTVTAVADTATVYEAALATGTQPALTTEAVTGNLLANDTGVSGTTEITSVNGVTPVGGVITISDATGTLVVYTQASGGFVKGDYVYTLNSATTQGVNDAPSFNYMLTNSFNGQTTNSTLNINIVDDAPVRIGDITQTLTSPSLTTYNLVLVIDRSGSMAFDAAGRASTDPLFDAASARMLIAKDALAELVKKFDGLGNVNVKIVDFSTGASETNWYIDDTTGAIDYINNLQPTGGTEYTTALNELITGYTQPPADKTLIYFVTDGDPNAGFALTTTSTPTIAQWENFVQNTSAAGNTSPSIAFGVGIGPSVSLTNLLPIAYPNNDTDPVDGQEDYAIRVVNPSDLAASLLATVDGGLVAGTVSVVSGAGSTSGFLLGADGGSVQSILVDGVTYSYSSGGPTNITINTNKGGQLEVDWITGTYTYSLVVNTTIQNQQEVFVVTAVDGDGDSASLNLVINLDYIANLDANRDTILTNVTAGTPINISSALLLHNDTLVNGTGTITATSGAVNGTVSGTSNIVFNPTATVAKTMQVETEALLNGNVYDNTSFAMNNVRENAVDLTDRTRYGTVLPGGQAWAVDVAGKTQVFSGRIANTATVKDVDYVKVRLFAGERIFIDVDNQSQNMIGAVEYFDGTGTLVSTSLALVGNAPNAYFTAPTDGEYYIRVESSATGTAASTNYNLLITLDQISGATDEHGQFDYTLNSGSGTTGATADIFSVAGTTIRGGEIDEVIIGGNTNDTLYGNGGNDAISGGGGSDTIYGGDGADRLDGGQGNDTLDGGAGNDILIGGAGNDILTGGAGSDTFVWNLADNGTVGAPASDTITDFNTAANVDKLDLRDLLQGETGLGVGANLDDYLHFEKVGANTVLHISNTGAFSSGFNAAQDTQVITLNNVDLVTGFADDQAIIQNLLTNNKLITD
jgi:large repetitive protein